MTERIFEVTQWVGIFGKVSLSFVDEFKSKKPLNNENWVNKIKSTEGVRFSGDSFGSGYNLGKALGEEDMPILFFKVTEGRVDEFQKTLFYAGLISGRNFQVDS